MHSCAICVMQSLFKTCFEQWAVGEKFHSLAEASARTNIMHTTISIQSTIRTLCYPESTLCTSKVTEWECVLVRNKPSVCRIYMKLSLFLRVVCN